MRKDQRRGSIKEKRRSWMREIQGCERYSGMKENLYRRERIRDEGGSGMRENVRISRMRDESLVSTDLKVRIEQE